MIFPDPREYDELLESITNALNSSFRNFTTEKEPQLIANLVWNLPNQINKSRISRRFQISCGGVFVHAQPLVKSTAFPYPKPSSVEIGDLLLLRTEKKREIVIDQRAMLLQAKKTDRFPATPNNKNQHYLYALWPHFEYFRSGGLSGKKRSVSGPDLYNGAKYLIVSQNFHPCFYQSPILIHGICFDLDSCSLTSQPSMPTLSHYRCFLDELASFILGNSGKTFGHPKRGTIGWDRVINDLIQETSKKYTVFMGNVEGTKGVKDVKAPRGNQIMFFQGRSSDKQALLFSIARMGKTSQGNSGNECPPVIEGSWPEDNEESSGISIIEFMVNTE